jgi:predicted  nucleic acid-binding Zn-ribbon protein
MGKHRTADERLAELQAQMVSLQIKAKKDEIAQNPEIKEIDAEIADLNNSALKWKRWQKDADQKIVDFQNRVTEWESRKDSASDWLDGYKAELEDLKARRDTVAEQALEEMEAESGM